MTITKEMLNTLNVGLSKRLTIDGKTNEYTSYFIPIKYLYYNNLNGRIATYIEEYNDVEGNDSVDILLEDNLDDYNDLVAGFIKQSSDDNEKSYKKTKKDIQEKGQQNPGVILSDGRIIDGNRRFTAIRELYKETGNDSFGYFEAVCLEAPAENDIDGWKRIKTLELNLQFNIDEKKDYNRIDFLVSFYKCTIDDNTKMFDKKQYCYASGMTPSEYESNCNIIKIMLDYLEWRGKPKAFYILKRERLDGPIEDIASATKKMNDEEWNEMKDYIYYYMTFVQSGDRTRDIRELVKSAKNNGVLFNEFKNKINEKPDFLLELAQTVEEKDKKPSTAEESQNIKKKTESISLLLSENYETAKYVDKIDTALSAPQQLLDNIIMITKKIDISVIKIMTPEQKNTIKEKLSDVEENLNGIKEALDE